MKPEIRKALTAYLKAREKTFNLFERDKDAISKEAHGFFVKYMDMIVNQGSVENPKDKTIRSWLYNHLKWTDVLGSGLNVWDADNKTYYSEANFDHGKYNVLGMVGVNTRGDPQFKIEYTGAIYRNEHFMLSFNIKNSDNRYVGWWAVDLEYFDIDHPIWPSRAEEHRKRIIRDVNTLNEKTLKAQADIDVLMYNWKC